MIVIPGRDEVASPESITTVARAACRIRENKKEGALWSF
jgi:hypothetical protein